MSYWKSKVAPKLKKLFLDKGGKKKGAANASKQFDSSKESLEKEIGEKTTDLSPKVIEIYRSSTVVSKKLLKESSESAVKENPDAAQTSLQALATAGFPGAQTVSDAAKKYGPALVTGPIVYLFGKTSTFLVDEPLSEPAQESREITIESIGEEKDKEPEALAGEAAKPPHTEPIAPVKDKSGAPSEEKKEATTLDKAKKEEPSAIVAEEKKGVAHPEAKKPELTPVEAKKEEAAPAPKEVKHEEATAAPSEGKTEKVKGILEEKKEEAKGLLGTEEKKEKPT